MLLLNLSSLFYNLTTNLTYKRITFVENRMLLSKFIFGKESFSFYRKIGFSNEAHFCLNRYLINQIRRIWCEEQLEALQELPIHPEKWNMKRRISLSNVPFFSLKRWYAKALQLQTLLRANINHPIAVPCYMPCMYIYHVFLAAI